MKVNLFIPYSRDYISRKYKVTGEDIFHLIENDIISTFLSKISVISRVKKIYFYSNELIPQNHSSKSKLEFIDRPPESYLVDSRQELIYLMDHSIVNEPLILTNPLFPLVSVETIDKFIDSMEFYQKNMFLGFAGGVRHKNKNSFSELERYYWDYGALTGYFDVSKLHEWKIFENFSSIETISIRNFNDIAIIKTIQSMGR
jgi:hypothetical protein